MWFGKIGSSAVVALAFSPDSRTLYTGDALGRVMAWGTATRTGRKLTGSEYPDTSSRFAVTPDGRHLVHVIDALVVRDAATGAIAERVGLPTGFAWHAQLAHDTRTLLAMAPDNSAVLRWDRGTGTMREPLRWQWPTDLRVPQDFALSPDGRTLAVGEWGLRIVLFDAATGAPRLRLDGLSVMKSLLFSPSGDYLISAEQGGRVGAFDLSSGRLLWVRDEPAAVIAFHPERPLVALCPNRHGKSGAASFLNVSTGEPVAVPAPGFKRSLSAAFSPDGLTCAVGGSNKQFAVFDVDI